MPVVQERYGTEVVQNLVLQFAEQQLRDISGIDASVALDDTGYPLVVPHVSARNRATLAAPSGKGAEGETPGTETHARVGADSLVRDPGADLPCRSPPRRRRARW
jgi:hypothetical protein